MTTRKAREEQEQPVKQWELGAVQKQVDQHEKLMPRVEQKLDTILTTIQGILTTIQGLPTSQQVDDKIKASKADMDDRLKDAIEKQDLKYAPIVSTNRWLLRAVVGTALTLLVAVIVLVIGVFTK